MLNWRALKPGEMPEYTLRFGNPTLSNWNCKRCWRSNTLSPYESKDKQMTCIANHIKAKYVIPHFSVRLIVREAQSLLHLHRHGIDPPTEEDYYFNWTDGVPQFVHLDGNNS